jgi:hypothetical protein
VNTIALWSCFAAVLLGMAALARQNLRFYGNGRFIRTYFLIWGGLAIGIGLFNMLSPGFRFPAWFLPVSIISMTLLFSVSVASREELSQRATQADLLDWYGLQSLRAYFGTVIVVGAALGLLPWAFALSAGVGDIAIGLIAQVLRRRAVRSPIAAWSFSLAGIADLINAGRMGAVVVTPWLFERQMPGFLLMLPLFGVPLMLANHVQTIRHLVRELRMQRLLATRR